MSQATRPIRLFPALASLDGFRLAAALLVSAMLGIVIGANVAGENTNPTTAATVGGYAVTDGWAHSPITRQGPGVPTARGVAVTDGWAHSPITRLGSAYDPSVGVAVTDGWAHSPITRFGSNDLRVATLRSFAAQFEAQGPAAEARSR